MLKLIDDPIALTAALVDIESVSGNETAIADTIAEALSALGTLTIRRDGDAIVASTTLGRPHRVILAGHIDTVPVADNLPSYQDGDSLYGCGTTDMKSGVAVMLHLAAMTAAQEPDHDLTFVFYDHEEVEAARNGLLRLVNKHPDWLVGDFAILLEPTNATVEAGCQGTLRATVRTGGRRAHSARSWLGDNAIHHAGAILSRLERYRPRQVNIDGCVYREGMNAVGITGGVAGNVIPDECVITVNFRFAPDLSEEQAAQHVRETFDGYEITITDSAPGALPGLNSPGMEQFLAAIGGEVTAKYGWTDVARFTQLGIPAVNFGPGDPGLAHTRNEHVQIEMISKTAAQLWAFLYSS
ncbi:MAG: succinyl-diaminopimelate desuccinylase [Corynebacteriales bacterium]|nr:succinyl-diaminopimelate desuccinylase [Mycobacteriales bacterium]